MSPRVFVIAVLVFLMKPFLPTVTAAGSQEQEYQQVRTIALRDARVRGAYEDADRRLEAKIIQIDPALAPYVQHRKEGQSVKAASAPVSAPKERSARVKLAAFSSPTAKLKSHIVAKGETLSGIAEKYGISVAALKSANHITDDKKLIVGRVLSIPANATKGRLID